MSIEKMLMHAMEKAMDRRRIVERIKITPEWKKDLGEMDALAEEVKFIMRKLEHKRDQFWSKVKEETEIYFDMRINEKKGVIEVLED